MHPRRIAKRAPHHNAAMSILACNRPAGIVKTSRTGEYIERHSNEAPALIDVRVLDHFIRDTGEVISLAERGLL